VEAKGDAGELNVRGCCFQHTADTELRMTGLAADVLAAADLDCANRPVASFYYKPEAAWPLPRIDRYCALFETLGNARLGDHLISGLMELLPHVVSEPPGKGFEELKGAIASGRTCADPSDLWPTAMVTSCGMPTADAASQLTKSGYALAETAPPLADAMNGKIPADLHDTWNAACSKLGSELEGARAAAGEPSCLLWLAWRLGWECGLAVRALHAAGISWGTYADAMGIHCNAHANNFVVKPPTVGRQTTFLAALDFDMAFTKAGFVPEAMVERASLGFDSWEGLLNFEATMGMKTVLSGDTFASTGVANSAVVPESHALVEMAFRDTLVCAYEAALEGSPDAHPHNAAMRAAAYQFIRLALCLTTHVKG
jgi:hypothetical protein